MSLVDLGDVWLRFNLREYLIKGMKVGDRLTVTVSALGDQRVVVAIRTIASRGEYAGWRATRATGDFDLRSFEIRAYPMEPLPVLRRGMSAFSTAPRPADGWPQRHPAYRRRQSRATLDLA